MTDKVAVIIPCLNEAATIASLVAEVKKFLPDVIVVDDGSFDDTGNLARSAGAEILRNPQPRGKGASLTLGFKRAQEKGFDWALAMDGDGQHAPSDIPLFLAAMTKAPLIIGNRMSHSKSMPWLRKKVNHWMSQRLSKLTHRNLPDTQCGFRLLRLECWAELEGAWPKPKGSADSLVRVFRNRQNTNVFTTSGPRGQGCPRSFPFEARTLNLRATHFEIESEILLQFIAAGHDVEFVPIEVIYKNERSKIHPWRDTWRWFAWLKNARRQFRDHDFKWKISSLKLSSPTTSPALQNTARLSLR